MITKLLITLLIIPFIEWAAAYATHNGHLVLSSAELWEFLLFTKYLSFCIGSQIIFMLATKQKLKLWSVTALNCLVAWASLADHIVWEMWGDKYHLSMIMFAVTSPLVIWVVMRNYGCREDHLNHKNVMLLFLRPISIKNVIPSFFGGPVSSICILANHRVWGFSHSAEKFVTRRFFDNWTKTHSVVDTGVRVTPEIIDQLGSLLGTPRGKFGVRCVYTIRGVLGSLGEQWRVRTPFDLIPGVYALRIKK